MDRGRTESILRTTRKHFHHFLSLFKCYIWYNQENWIFWKRPGWCEFPNPSLVVGSKSCNFRKMGLCRSPIFFCQCGTGEQASDTTGSFPFLQQDQPKLQKQQTNKQRTNRTFLCWFMTVFYLQTRATFFYLSEVKWSIKVAGLSTACTGISDFLGWFYQLINAHCCWKLW